MAKEETSKAANVNPDVLDFGATIGSKVEKRLTFKPRVALNGLCQGRLVSVKIEKHLAPELNAKTNLPSTWEYAGLEIPNLVLEFLEDSIKEDPAERWYEHRFSAFTVVKNNGEAAKRSAIVDHYQRMYNALQHIANVFTTNANFSQAPVPAFNPFLENPIPRLAGLEAWFESWVKTFSGKDGKGLAGQSNYIKLVASPEGTYLTFPGFIGQGFIEKAKDGMKPTIELKPSDSIVLTKKDAKKSTTAPGASGAESGEGNISPEMQAILDGYTGKA